MRTNEIFIADVAGRYMSFTLTYSNDAMKCEVGVIVACHSLDSYNGAVDLTFEDLPSAVSFFNGHGEESCVRYELLLGYRIKE